MTAQVTIGPATPADLPPILQLLERAGLPTAGLADHLGHAVVARHGERIVASAALEIYEGGALLRSVVVDPGLRGTGLGHRITQAALANAEAAATPAVFLLTTTAEGFFPRFGFSIIDRSEVPPGLLESAEFRSACPASAIVMRKIL